MGSDRFRFDEFELDAGDRQLRRRGEPVDLSGRYLDALDLLVRNRGRLVTKDMFMDAVWRGIPVTDEALTQCIRSIRKVLGDDAARPFFIQTVPRHGYRFIAAVEPGDGRGGRTSPHSERWRRLAGLAAAASAGGALAGLVGGLFYGFALSGEGLGSASTVLVLLSVTVAVGLAGAVGVGAGIALSALRTGRIDARAILGGAIGGLIVGALVKLIGSDALALLVGQSPGDITGAPEGAVLGGAVGLAAWLALRDAVRSSRRWAIAYGALAGTIAGAAIFALGGRLMAGSLDLIARSYPESRLRLDELGAILGQPGFDRFAGFVVTSVEGGLFGACVVGVMALAQKRLEEES